MLFAVLVRTKVYKIYVEANTGMYLLFRLTVNYNEARS